MACNCATSEQIEALYKKFGESPTLSKDASIKLKVKNFFTKIAVTTISILIIPYLLCYVLYVGIFGDGRISLAEFFGFREKIVK